MKSLNGTTCSREYDFSLKSTSLQCNTTFLWKVQVCSEVRLLLKKVQFFSEYTFSLRSTSLQWIRLFFERYKFAVNTTFRIRLEKGTSLQWIRRLLLKKVQFFSYAFSLRSTSLRWKLFFGRSLQWIRLFFERYKFAVNTTFVKKGTNFQWKPLFFEKYKFAVNTTFLKEKCNFSLRIRLVRWEVQVCGEYDFSLKRTGLQWIRLFFERYKFAVNTTFLWKVQVCSEFDFAELRKFEYDFSLKGTSLQCLQWIRLLLKKVQFVSEYTFSLRSTGLLWIRLFFEREKFAVNTTFVWTVKGSEYDYSLKR